MKLPFQSVTVDARKGFVDYHSEKLDLGLIAAKDIDHQRALPKRTERMEEMSTGAIDLDDSPLEIEREAGDRDLVENLVEPVASGIRRCRMRLMQHP